MKQDLTLQQLAEAVVSRADKKSDLLTDTRNITALTDGSLRVGEHALTITDHCHGQIADRLNIPVKYYKRMLINQPELWTENLNTWLHEEPETRLVRTLEGRARAYLSNRYMPLDDDEFVSTVMPIVADAGGTVLSTSITGTKTYIKFVSERLTRDVRKGDPVQFGIAFSNSEVGAGRLTGSLFCYRLVCTNGQVIKDEEFATNHVGRQRSSIDLEKVMELDTIHADARATMLKMRDYSSALLSETFIDRQVERMQGLTQLPIGNPIKAVEVVTKKNTFNESTKSNILTHLIKGGDLTMWGLQNAITRAAEDEQDYDEATRLETVGGDMLTLSKTDYKVLAEAA